MIKKEVTIYDIAKQLNISSTTVSRGLNDHPSVNIKTKNRILETAKKMGYRPNHFASNLRKQQSNTIGVIIPKIDSLFMSSVISGIEEVANKAGYNLIISQSLESEEKEISNAQTMFSSRVDGVLVSLSNKTNNLNHFKQFKERGTPVLFFDRAMESPNFTKVVIDNEYAGYTASKHLLEQGCRNIYHITGPLQRKIYQDRLAGYKKALEEFNIPYSTEKVFTGMLEQEKLTNCLVNTILKQETPPDGIFISNDFSAALAIKTIKDQQLKVPQDIAVIGFNNDLISTVTSPTISTIDYPGKEMGMCVTTLLIDHLAQKEDLSLTRTITLNTSLIVRESTSKNNPHNS